MARPRKQYALVLDSKCGQFSIRERDIPKPGSGQLLVKHCAIAMNPIEWKIQADGGEGFVKYYPAVLGEDISGIVEEIGAGVSGFKKGDRL